MVDIINPLVSEKVMCWHREVLPNNDEGLPYFANFWVDCENVKQKPVNFWSPTTSLEDAWVVVDKLREKYDVKLDIQEKSVWCEFNDGKNKVLEYADTAQLAICVAALKLYGVELGDTYRKSK